MAYGWQPHEDVIFLSHVCVKAVYDMRHLLLLLMSGKIADSNGCLLLANTFG